MSCSWEAVGQSEGCRGSSASCLWPDPRCEERTTPARVCFAASACSASALSHRPMRITGPRPKEQKRPLLWLGEAAESRCRVRGGWEGPVAILQAAVL